MYIKILILIIWMVFTLPIHAGVWDSVKNIFAPQEKTNSPTIKILIAHDIDAAMMEVKGKYSIWDPYKNKKIGPTRFFGKSNLIQPLLAGLKWGEEFPDLYQISIIPGEQNGTVLVNGIEYQGMVTVYNIGGAISIVNEVDVEDYLSSTLDGHLDKTLSEEALAAAVISARTDAYYQIMMGRTNPYWDVEMKRAGFQGSAVMNRDEKLSKALISTKYMVLSRTDPHDTEIVPFPIELVSHRGKESIRKSGLPLDEVKTLAEKGDHAAKILSKIFPHTVVRLTYVNDDSSLGIVKK